MYIKENNYRKYAEELSENADKVQFDGYKTPVDEYFSAVLVGDAPPRPRRRYRAGLLRLLTVGKSNEPHRAELSSYILDGAGDGETNLRHD